MPTELVSSACAPTTGSTGLLWGVDFLPEGPSDIGLHSPRLPGVFRWLHFSLADQASRQWINAQGFSPAVAETLLGRESYQSSFVENDVLACVLQDLQRDFDIRHVDQAGSLHVALMPDLMITTRLHPLGFTQILRQKLAAHREAMGPGHALDMLASAIVENQAQYLSEISHKIQQAEDTVLAGGAPPESRALLAVRRQLALLHRMTDGMSRVFLRLEADEDLAPAMAPVVEKLAQKMQGMDQDVLAIQAQVRMLREELELASNQRINRNLFTLSVLSVLLMPATLVTGFFGMNTGSLPMTGHEGTWGAGALAVAASGLAFVFLRWRKLI